MSKNSELEELRKLRALQREENENKRLEEIKKQNEKNKKEAFLNRAKLFEQKKGPTDEEKKAIIQKAATNRKFDKILKKTLKENENINPLALEYQLKNQSLVSNIIQSKTNINNNNNIHSDWELVEQVGAPSYYWNRITNETTYTPPTIENNDSTSSQPPPPPPPPPRFQLPGLTQQNNDTNDNTSITSENNLLIENTNELQSTDNGNNNNGNTQSQILSEEDQGWLSCQNSDGTIYYWNYLTNESVLTLPSHLDPNNVPPYVAETTEENNYENILSDEDKLQAESDPLNWVIEWDDYYQANYYRNKITETLQWNAPDCLKKDEEKSNALLSEVVEVAAGIATEAVEAATTITEEIVNETLNTESNSKDIIDNNSNNESNKKEEELVSSPIVVEVTENNQTIPPNEEIKKVSPVVLTPVSIETPVIESKENSVSEVVIIESNTSSSISDVKDEESSSLQVEVTIKSNDNVIENSNSLSKLEEPHSNSPSSTPSISTDPSSSSQSSQLPPKVVSQSPPPPPPPPPRQVKASTKTNTENEKPVDIVNPVVSISTPSEIKEQLPQKEESGGNKELEDIHNDNDSNSNENYNNIVVDIDHEIESNENQNSHKDDELLTGDGSKPVGCTSCSIM